MKQVCLLINDIQWTGRQRHYAPTSLAIVVNVDESLPLADTSNPARKRVSPELREIIVDTLEDYAYNIKKLDEVSVERIGKVKRISYSALIAIKDEGMIDYYVES